MGNEDLLRYFEERPVQISEFIPEWHEFINSYLNEKNLNAFLNLLGHSDKTQISPSDYTKMPLDGKRFFADWLEESGVAKARAHGDVINAPAWMLLEPTSDQLLSPQTQIVHYTNDADAIVQGGMQWGVSDIDRIAVTHFNDIWGARGRSTHNGLSKGAGFNCGFRFNTHAEAPHHAQYGSQAVVFETSGLECHHLADRDNQVFFWGPTINQQSIRRVK